MRTLFIFRHGETDWNKAGRFQGRVDIPLNETGRAQAKKLREFFVANPVDVFLSSDLERARETAEIAAGGAGVPIVLDARLRETNLGDAEGLTQDEVIAKFGKEALEGWRSLDKDHRDFRFPNGETKLEHLARVFEGVDEFLRTTNYKRIGVASHGGAMRRLIHHFAPHLTEPVLVTNCALYRIDYDPSSKEAYRLHLEPLC
jgi:broad specificity phosphatase PhoE